MKKSVVYFILVMLLVSSILFCEEVKETKIQKENEMKLIIANFIEDSNLLKAGAQIGDRIISYNGTKVNNLKVLNELKQSVETFEVEIVLIREEQELKFTIPKGQIGVYLKELMPEHKIDENAVIIEGIGKLDWVIGMENSFLGAFYLLDEKFRQNTSYEDIVGLSGYGFRLHFFDGWCPSSPDATCGKDIGSEILKKLGYKFEAFHLEKEEFEKMNTPLKSEEEFREIIIKSIDAGWPVIAIDLIEVPEWCIITGYQKEGKEFFCRTYFDKTDGYEIARKFPWVIFVIKDKEKTDVNPLYKESLTLTNELYNTEKYESYFSGITAIQQWITALENEKSFVDGDKEKFDEMKLTNWWIYYSLMEARSIAKGYLLNNIKKFEVEDELIKQLADLYEKEAELLYNNFKDIPSPHVPKEQSIWDTEARSKQIEILKELLTLEEKANDILKKIGK